MKWTITVALVTGFALVMALAFGGRGMNGLHVAKSDEELMPADCCAHPLRVSHRPRRSCFAAVVWAHFAFSGFLRD